MIQSRGHIEAFFPTVAAVGQTTLFFVACGVQATECHFTGLECQVDGDCAQKESDVGLVSCTGLNV